MTEIEKMKRVTGEWYLYYSIKNENALIPVIVCSFITLFLKQGVIISLGIWMWYIMYCSRNNEDLNNNPSILTKRETWMKIHKEEGEEEKYKKLLGIK